MDSTVIHKLRTNKQLTSSDLEELENKLTEIGREDGRELLDNLMGQKSTNSIVNFVRMMVGMDRTAANEAFSQFLSDRSLNASQIRFIEMIIDHLTSRGVMEASALYESPFKNLHSGGPEALFSISRMLLKEYSRFFLVLEWKKKGCLIWIIK